MKTEDFIKKYILTINFYNYDTFKCLIYKNLVTILNSGLPKLSQDIENFNYINYFEETYYIGAFITEQEMAYKIKNKLSRIRYCCKVNKFYTCNKITNLWSEYPEDSEKLNILSEIIIQMIEYSFYIIKEEKDYLLGRLVGNEKEGKEQRKNI